MFNRKRIVLSLIVLAVACVFLDILDVKHQKAYGLSGLTADQAANQCINAAKKASGTCDLSFLAGKQSFFGQVNVGDAAGSTVNVIFPASCYWQFSLTDGNQSAIEVFDHASISGIAPPYGCKIVNTSQPGGAEYMFRDSGDGYVRAGGFTIVNQVATEGRAACYVPGALDNSYFHDIECFDYVPTEDNWRVGGDGRPCCDATFARITSDSGNTGGVPFHVVGNSRGTPNAIMIQGASLGHPAPGLPIFLCSDTSLIHNTDVWMVGIYEEGSNTDDHTPMNQVQGCGQLTVTGMTVKAETPYSRAPIWSFTNDTDTSFDISGLYAILNFEPPIVAIETHIPSPTCLAPPCKIMIPTHKGTMSHLTLP